MPDRFNIFGNPYGSSYPNYDQHIFLNATTSGSTDPGKLTGAWIYLPSGYLELNSALGGSCTPANTDCWNVNGRIWVRNLKAYGDLAFRVPPSKGNYVLSSFNNAPITVVPWTGTVQVEPDVVGTICSPANNTAFLTPLKTAIDAVAVPTGVQRTTQIEPNRLLRVTYVTTADNRVKRHPLLVLRRHENWST
jgi:hypothetical protein